jgi:hypothetical protein
MSAGVLTANNDKGLPQLSGYFQSNRARQRLCENSSRELSMRDRTPTMMKTGVE